MLGKRNRLLILLFLFGSVLFATPDDNFDREISLNEVLTQYKLKNFSVVLRLANRTTPLNRSENLALNYLRAHSFLQLKEYKNALEQFLNLLGEVPYKYEIFNNIGACYFYLGDYENALRYFDFSKTENPNYKIAEKNYILLRNATATKTLESNWISPTDFPETFLVFSSANADISTGWIYFYLGKPTEAIHLFKKRSKVIRNILSHIYLWDICMIQAETFDPRFVTTKPR